MAENFQRLKTKRTALRTVVSKLLKKIEDSLKSENKDDLKESYDLIIEKKGNLKKLDDEIHELIELESLESDVIASEEYQEKCSRIIKRVNLMLKSDIVQEINTDKNRSTFQAAQSSVKLPKLLLEKYSGDPTKFNDFWNSFENTIHNNQTLNKIEKFAYLKTLLVGPASNVVAGLELNEGNYDESLKTLKDRFGKKDIIVSQFMNKLLNLEPVRSSRNVKGLRKLYDDIEIAVRNLEAQNVTKGSYGQLLIPVLLKSIPDDLVLEFNRSKKSKEEIQVSDLLNFIKTEVECREVSNFLIHERKSTVPPRPENSQLESKKYFRNVPTAASFNTVDNRACIFCDKFHDSFSCDKSVKEKLCKLRDENRCYLCFKRFHVSRVCKNKKSCSKCGFKSHHESVCTNNQNRNKTRWDLKERKNEDSESKQNETVLSENTPDEQTLSVSNSVRSNTLLQTCSVLAYSNGKSEKTNLILDSGSTRSFVHVNLVKKLGLKIIGEEKLSLFCFGMKEASPKTFPIVEFFVSDKQKSRKLRVKCLVSNVITAAPLSVASEQTLEKMNSLGLEIADMCDPSENVEVLVGVDYFWQIVGEKISLSREIYAVSTMFGYMPVGMQFNENGAISQNCVLANMASCLQDSLRTLWSLEFMGINDDTSMSNETRDQIEHFENGISMKGDRYSVNLLWKSDAKELEDNFSVALRRFENLKIRLIRNPPIYEQYKNVIEEQLKEGIIEECSQETKSSYFMPHREVIKHTETTRCRIVYDASSSRSKGVKSLNELLDIGPNLNPLVLDMILKFRKFEIAFNGDIAKAFLMIEISEKDRDFLKFIWFGDNGQNYKILRFARLPFGLCCSPAILAMVIKFHIRKYENTNPEAYAMLNSSMYVDDLYYGCDTVEDACRLSSDAVKIFKDAGMNLRKLKSNSEQLNSFWMERGFDVGEVKESKMLGMIWTPETDKIKLNCDNFDHMIENTQTTKRTILQTLASIYDPIGISQPFIIRMKILLQQIWTLGINWDEALPSEIINEWLKWKSEIKFLKTLEIPRKYFHSSLKNEVSLHLFADASPKAYGAVAYFRYLNSNGSISTSFITAKGRVAPLKPLTLPRLELMAALVAARLAKYLTGLFPELCDQIFLWSDSQITLHWVKGQARDWKPFVSNRVSEIQSLTDPQMWFHCSGKENPADLVSRGDKASNLVKNSLWLQGPSWLAQAECDWPMNKTREINENSIAHEKRSQAVNTCQAFVHDSSLLDLTKFSKLLKVYRITAYVLRFVNNIKKNSRKVSGPLSAEEIEIAELYWVRVTQNQHFGKEILDLSNHRPLDKKSTLYSLNPELDEHGVLRLKGRLQFSNLDVGEKHPWVLPYKDKLSELIILDGHNKVLHAGVESTLAQIREKFWILKGRQLVKSTLKRCFVCKRYKVRSGTQDIAPLPPERVLESPPFSVTGLDFAGPFFIKGSSNKHYLLLFTCATTRALHLELVPSMNTEHFLLAFRKFIARRGLCRTIYSDNAKTFHSAESELKKIWTCIQHPSVKTVFASYGIKWKYIVERGPWWGGFWERHFRTIKTCLRKIIGRSSLTFFELETVFVEIEAMINSRPITYINDDPSEPSPLSPSHFLVGNRLLSLPASRVSKEESTVSRQSLRRKYKYQQTLLNHFWNRWRKSYLLNLRSVNVCPSNKLSYEFKIGDVVLLHDDRLPRNMWTMGKITETYPGRDGKIRSCMIKTQAGNYKRPVQLLYNLEVTDL